MQYKLIKMPNQPYQILATDVLARANKSIWNISAKIIGADIFQNQAVYYKGEKQQSAEHWLMCYAMLSFYDGKVKFSSAEENLTFPS